MVKEDHGDLVSKEGHCQPWTVWILERLLALLIVYWDPFPGQSEQAPPRVLSRTRPTARQYGK